MGGGAWFDAREPAARAAVALANAALIRAIGTADLPEIVKAADVAAHARASVAAIDAERAALLASSEVAREAVARVYAEYDGARRKSPATRAPAVLLVPRSWPVSAFDFDWAPAKKEKGAAK